MANGTPTTPQIPGWIGQVAALTAQVGVPTMVAAVLLYFVLFRIDASMKYIQAQEDARTLVVQQMQREILDRQREILEVTKQQTTAFQDAINKNIASNEVYIQRLERALAPR